MIGSVSIVWATVSRPRGSGWMYSRDVWEWLSTFPFPPISIYSIPIPSHTHSHFLTYSHSHGIPVWAIPIPPIPIPSVLKLYIISDTVIIIICS